MSEVFPTLHSRINSKRVEELDWHTPTVPKYDNLHIKTSAGTNTEIESVQDAPLRERGPYLSVFMCSKDGRQVCG